MDTQTHCHVSNQVNIHTDVTEVPDYILNDAFNELKDDLLYDGSVKIGTNHYHVTDLYQYGDEEEQARVISLAFRFPEEASQLAQEIITKCASVYFKNNHPELTLEWYADKHSEH
jgi:hypothetical protein|tara:strand:- start:755 stop:1099 length:345 start_codon:yes stop_codon:yes gene_type:complete